MRLLLVLIVSLFVGVCSAQTLRVGSYNLENLFDTINHPSVDDAAFTPLGKRRWTYEKYAAKRDALARAVALFSPDILGVCEVENEEVLRDFSSKTKRLHGVVHYDSKDTRGIDVAMLYDTAKLLLLSSEPIYVGRMRRPLVRADFSIKNSKQTQVLHVVAVHLPSKLGGAGAAKRRDEALAAIDSVVHSVGPWAVVVGDFNDSPRKGEGILYNSAWPPAQRGEGSYAYRDVWDMIDQICLTRALLPYVELEQRVVRDASLIRLSGKYKGYPLKGVVSDHLPIYLDVTIR